MLVGSNMLSKKKEFIQDIDLNKSSKGCNPCFLECKKINKRINERSLSKIKSEEVPQILKVFDF